MTISDGPPGGPILPSTGGSGRFAWSHYASGDTIRCPGHQERRGQLDRAVLGDRRHESRPCPQNWGRVSGLIAIKIRVKPMRADAQDSMGQLVKCPTCRLAIQIVHLAADEAA